LAIDDGHVDSPVAVNIAKYGGQRGVVGRAVGNRPARNIAGVRIERVHLAAIGGDYDFIDAVPVDVGDGRPGKGKHARCNQ
jgi:hypothetical protein